MRILTLPVDDLIANSYYNATSDKKEKINSLVNTVLSRLLADDSSLISSMNEMSAEAQRNGLTVEKLGEIMEWDGETIKNLFGEQPGINA